jgi:hypothetical protein
MIFIPQTMIQRLKTFNPNCFIKISLPSILFITTIIIEKKKRQQPETKTTKEKKRENLKITFHNDSITLNCLQ